MPIVTRIASQKNQKRVNVYLDDKFGFGVDLDNFVKLGLKVGQELTEERVGEVVKKAEFQKTLDKLLRFATLRPRSEKEIGDWMRRKKVHGSLHKKLFDKLKRLDLADDVRFAKWWVEQRQNFRPKSSRILKSELRIKGISKEIIDEVLEETQVDEVKIAGDLIEKKQYRWERFDRMAKKKKMQEYLARKGFGWEVVEKVLKEK